MSEIERFERFESINSTHEFYLNILNALPDVVYWVDADCVLQGCNQAFIKWLGLQREKDLNATPYELMTQFTPWSEARIESFRLDDMQVIFSGTPQYEVEETPVMDEKGRATYFLSRRVPLYEQNQTVTGLVVILTDITAQKKLEAQVQSNTSKGKTRQSSKRQSVKAPSILMVEDNRVAQKVEEALLTGLSCRVDIADSGDMALELFGPGKYDIVFMDIGLGDTSGYMVAKRMRQMEENTDFHVPIIALTTYEAEIIKNDCKDYFMDGVLTKPLTGEQAKQIIQHFVHHEDVPVKGLKAAK